MRNDAPEVEPAKTTNRSLAIGNILKEDAEAAPFIPLDFTRCAPKCVKTIVIPERSVPVVSTCRATSQQHLPGPDFSLSADLLISRTLRSPTGTWDDSPWSRALLDTMR